VSSDDVIARFQPAYDAASRGDLEAWLEMLDPDVEIHQSPDLVGTKGIFRGREGAVQVMAELYDAFEWIDWLPKRGYELGPDRYVVLLKPVGRGKGSGVEVESEIVQLLETRKGKISRIEAFVGWETGLAAAGISADVPAD
jgi:ketosteroid isomerase-like protein